LDAILFVLTVHTPNHHTREYPGSEGGEQAHELQRIVLNGSFVTDIMEPNDVDCVLLIGRGFPADPMAEAELNAGLPFLEMKLVGQADFDEYVNAVFGTDLMGVPRGMVEICQ